MAGLMTRLLEARRRKWTWYVLATVGTLVLGLASRRYPQVFPAAMGKYPGDLLWSLMVYFGMAAIFNKASNFEVGFRALCFAFGIEALKLCQAPWLASLRHTPLGHLVFGHVFSWQNLVAYALGVLLGLLIEALVVASEGQKG